MGSMDETNKERLEAAVSKMKYKNNWMAGISPPMGYFDPLGFSTQLSTGKLLFYREVELKHGRVAMLASLGLLVGEQFHPLFGGNIDVPGIFAFQQTPLETFWPAVVAAISIPEIYSVFTFDEPGSGKDLVQKEQWSIKADHMPGDLGFDPLGLKPTNEKELVEMQTKELNNGRLAMIALPAWLRRRSRLARNFFRRDGLRRFFQACPFGHAKRHVSRSIIFQLSRAFWREAPAGQKCCVCNLQL